MLDIINFNSICMSILKDKALYQPLFSQWLYHHGNFAKIMAEITPFTLVSPDRVYMLYTLGHQALHFPGNFWECGVYKGGTAMMLAQLIAATPSKHLRLFDTFDGMPVTDPNRDFPREGDFSDTSLNMVKQRVGDIPAITYYPGFIPDSFKGFEQEKIALAHIDVDIYLSVRDCCEFIYPLMVNGGFMVFDDYGFPSCPGAREAVDEFFSNKPESPLVLPTGQALVIKIS